MHSAGPVYFVQERSLAKRRSLERFLIATTDGWNLAYSDSDRTVPMIASAIDPPISRSLIARLIDAQRGFLRPFGTRFGDWTRGESACSKRNFCNDVS